jgi:hypothetical protein
LNLYIVNGIEFPTYEAALDGAASIVSKLVSKGFVPLRGANAPPELNDGAEVYVMARAKPGGGIMFDGAWLIKAGDIRQQPLGKQDHATG